MAELPKPMPRRSGSLIYRRTGKMRRLPRRILFHRNGKLRGIFRRLLASRIGQSELFHDLFLQNMGFGILPKGDLPVVLVICHEASRTGAPILGWNIVRHLSSKYRVVTVLLRGGELEGNFRAASTTVQLGWADRSPRTMHRVAERLVANYQPLYAITNSIETSALAPPLAQLGVPVVALVHEFASYTRPFSKLSNVFDWASNLVYSARMVLDSSLQQAPGLESRTGVHLLPQGRSEIPRPGLPKPDPRKPKPPPPPVKDLRPSGREGAFVVLGAGSVQIRKGVEAFISTAAAARRLRPDLDLLFVWIGEGFSPQYDLGYSIYLDEQIKRSQLGDSLIMRDAVEDLDTLYQQADVFFMSSRLDPQPNVGIDAMTYGIPTIAFEGGAGTAEILAADPATRKLVVPHLDAHAAAELICSLADRRDDLGGLRREVERVAKAVFNMPHYVEQLDEFGRAAAERSNPADVRILVESDRVDPSFVFAPHEPAHPAEEVARTAMLHWRLWNGIAAGERGVQRAQPFRRGCAGFHPTIYALAHRAECVDGSRDPMAHWIASGRPAGPWSRQVHIPLAAPEAKSRVALHAHFHYPELIGDLLDRLRANKTPVDLFLTTDTEEKAATLAAAVASYAGLSRIEITPNRGRDIGPFLTGVLKDIVSGDYDVVGHIHAKRSLAIDAAMGERWRSFLWENLVGGPSAMVDTAASAFAANVSLGLLMAEDPHVVGWDQNRPAADALAARMGLALPLPDFLDFPLGTMFWARTAALKPLLDLKLSWGDYPEEPLPDDGTILHAIERLLPSIVQHAGFETAGLRVPKTTW